MTTSFLHQSSLTIYTLICLLPMLVNTNVATSSDSNVTASNTTGIPITDGSFSRSELEKFGHVDGVWGKLIIGHEINQYMDPITVLKVIKGFASSLVTIYNMGQSMVRMPQTTLDDVVKKIDTEFKDMKTQLTEIASALQRMEIYTYRDVDLAVDKSISDMAHKTKTDLATRAIGLYDQLFTFLRGILGIHTASPDLLVTLRNLYDCGSKNIMKTVERFVTLVNVGALGIGYYSTAINNKDIFDGDARIQTLHDLRDAVQKRTNDFMNTCASMSTSTIEKYMNKILSSKQKDSDTTSDVSRSLYERFDDIYPSNINWVFYTVWDFYPLRLGALRFPPQSDRLLYTGSGTAGSTRNGGWSVYWVGHPLSNNAGSQISVDTGKITAVLDEMKEQTNLIRIRDAEYVEKSLPYSIVSGRASVFWLIIANPKSSASVGNPLGKLNVYYKRFRSDFKYLPRGFDDPYVLVHYFDIVIL